MNIKSVGKRRKKVARERAFMDLTGEVAIVTGGRGYLGSEFVRTLTANGARVVSLDITIPRKGSNNEYLCDVTKKVDVVKTYDDLIRRIGTPTILINCAGIDSPPQKNSADTGPFEDVSENFWDAVIDSHLKGAFFMSQEFIRAARRAKLSHASIINISSMYGLVSPDQSLYDFLRRNKKTFFKPAAYSVAKSGMLNLTRWLAEYAAPFHIRVNTLALGGVFHDQPTEFIKEYAKRTPLKRLARRDEYNGAILFLASDRASSYVTGSTLVADGGYTAR